MQHINKTKSFLLYAGILLAPAAVSAQGIYISSGASLVMSGQPHLVLNNAGFTNNGNFTSSASTVWFTGNDSTRSGFIGGSNSGNYSFYNMAIARQSGNVQLRQNITVTDSMRMNTGNLLLRSYSLNLPYNSLIAGENERSYITADSGGYIQLTRFPLRAPVAYNPGNIGIELTSATTLAAITVYRRHVPAKLPNGKPGIKRVFYLYGLSSGSTTVRFHYFDAELPGVSESTLSMYKGDSTGFIQVGRDSIDILNNVVVTSGITGLIGYFTLGGDSITIDQPILVTNPTARQATTPATDAHENISDKIQVFPVPAHDYFIVSVASDRKQQSEFLLFDEMGHLLQRKKAFLLSGSNNISWDISSYPTGIYYMTSNNKKMSKIKIIKQ